MVGTLVRDNRPAGGGTVVGSTRGPGGPEWTIQPAAQRSVLGTVTTYDVSGLVSNALSFALQSPPAHLSIDGVTGIITDDGTRSGGGIDSVVVLAYSGAGQTGTSTASNAFDWDHNFATAATIDYGSIGGNAPDPANVFASQEGGATTAQQTILDALQPGDTFRVVYGGTEFTFTPDDGVVVNINDSGAQAAVGNYTITNGIEIHKIADGSIVQSDFVVTVAAPAEIIQSSLSINAAGNELTLGYGVNIQIGSGGNTGLTVEGPGGPITATFDRIVGANAVYTLSPIVGAGQAITASYVNPGDGIESVATSGDGQDFTDESVTNNSTADVTAPALSNPSADPQSSTTVNILATSDDDEGVLYWAARQGGSQLAEADIENGTGAALFTGSQNVTTPGLQTIQDAAGFSPTESYFIDLFHRDAANNSSDVVSTAEFTMSAGPPVFANIPDQALVRDEPFSLNLNDFCDPDAAYTIISGAVAALPGLAFNPPLLEGTPTGSTPANLQFRATTADGDDDSNVVAFTISDAVPDAFSIAPLDNQEPGELAVFAAVFPQGFLDEANFTTTNAEVSVSGGPFQTSGTINPGQSFRARITTDPLAGGIAIGTVTIGGVSADAIANNRAADNIPEALDLGAAGGVPVGSSQESAIGTVSGIDAGVQLAIAVTSGEYRINGGNYETTAGQAQLGDTIQARGVAPGTEGDTTLVLVNVGGVVNAFPITSELDLSAVEDAPIIQNFNPALRAGVIEDTIINSGATI